MGTIFLLVIPATAVGIEYRLEPVEGITVGGRLWVKGPNVMLGYYLANQPGQLIPPAERWHNTGDIVSIDNKGYITVEGRMKRFKGEAEKSRKWSSSESMGGLIKACLEKLISRGLPNKWSPLR